MELLSRTDRSEWALVDDLYPQLRRFAAVVAPLDLEPDDLLQEALVSVLRSHQLTDLDHPFAYLRKAILTTAISHNRRMGRRRATMNRFGAPEAVRVVPNYPSDLTDLVVLPPRERAALYLHEIEGYRYSEIGQLLGCTEAAARKAGARGRRRLEEIYAGEVTG